MEPIYKHSLFSLDYRSVVIQTDIYLMYEGKQVKVRTEKGQILNTEEGRAALDDMPGEAQNVKQAILAMWGDELYEIPNQSAGQAVPTE